MWAQIQLYKPLTALRGPKESGGPALIPEIFCIQREAQHSQNEMDERCNKWRRLKDHKEAE